MSENIKKDVAKPSHQSEKENAPERIYDSNWLEPRETVQTPKSPFKDTFKDVHKNSDQNGIQGDDHQKTVPDLVIQRFTDQRVVERFKVNERS